VAPGVDEGGVDDGVALLVPGLFVEGAAAGDQTQARVVDGPVDGFGGEKVFEFVLRAKEFDLLARLAAEPGTAVSREVLMAEVWDEHWFGSTKTLDVHVSALRRKLAAAAQERGTRAPDIVTLRGRGYRLEGR